MDDTKEMEQPLEQKNKIRTSISVDPDILRRAQVHAHNPRNGFASVSHLVESVLRNFLDGLGT